MRAQVPRVRGSKGRVICPIFIRNAYPYHGVGFKLGDPFAITYKFYPSEHFAAVADIGFAASGLYSRYHRSLFESYVPKNLSSTQSISYITHNVPTDLCFQAKLMYQHKVDVIFKGMQVYGGIGWQWRLTDLHYKYSFADQDPLAQNANKLFNFNYSRFTTGAVAFVGFEYSYFSLPISAFIEMEVFVDTFADPGNYNFQGGIGVRYIFGGGR